MQDQNDPDIAKANLAAYLESLQAGSAEEVEAESTVEPVGWANLQGAIAGNIIGMGRTLLRGASDDLNAYALQVASDIVEALSSGRMDLVEEMRDQGALIVELQRIRLTREARGIMQAFVKGLVSVLLAALPLPFNAIK